MFFRNLYVLRDLQLPESEALEFGQESPYATLVIVRPAKGDKSDLKEGDCLGTLQTEELVSERVRHHFDIPEPVHQAVDEIDSRVISRFSDLLHRTIGVLRWRRGETGHPNPIVTSQGLQWSDDGEDWKPVPGAIRLKVEFAIPWQRMIPRIRQSVTEMVNSGEREPIAHELFREAWNQRNDLPRSSLLIGMTAAEVGVKTFVGDLVPQAEWLAFNLPTPPLAQILDEYLPLLPVRQHITGVTPFVPKEIIATLRKGVKLRNETAHAGKQVKHETLKEILKAVRDLLYLLDLYAGHAWALETISSETRKLLSDASLKHDGKGTE